MTEIQIVCTVLNRGNVVNVVPQQMGMVVEEVGPCFHSGLTTCTHSSSRDLTLTPMRMPMPMPTTTWTSTTTSTRYRLPGTLIASPPPTIISRITTVTITTIIRVTITIIVIIITITTITTITIIRFKSISISPEISVIETPVLVCKVTRLPERFCTTECSSLFSLIACSICVFFFFLSLSFLFLYLPTDQLSAHQFFVSTFTIICPSICFVPIYFVCSFPDCSFCLCPVLSILSTHLCLHVCRLLASLNRTCRSSRLSHSDVHVCTRVQASFLTFLFDVVWLGSSLFRAFQVSIAVFFFLLFFLFISRNGVWTGSLLVISFAAVATASDTLVPRMLFESLEAQAANESCTSLRFASDLRQFACYD